MSKKNSKNIVFLLNALWIKINPKRKRKIIYLIFIILLSSFSEIISLSSVIPFIGFLTSPEYFLDNIFPRYLSLNLNSIDNFSLLVGITSILILSAFLSGFLKVYTQWEIRKLAANLGSDFSIDLYRKLLYQPYTYHINIESSDILSVLTADISDLINLLITPLLTLIASSFIASGLIISLLIINGNLSLITFFIIFLIYFIALRLSSNSLLKLGYQKVYLRSSFIKNIQEAMGSIREIILDNNHEFYVNIHKSLDKPLRKVIAKIAILSIIPKSLVDPAGISIIAIIGLFLALNGDINNSLPFLGAIVLGAQKLIPHFQNIYQSWTSIKGSKAILEKVVILLNNKTPKKLTRKRIKPLQINEDIKFKKVNFIYKSNTRPILANLNLTIRKGEKVGIIGKTGSGKSTIVDLLMGLLEPLSGEILIDNLNINDPINSSLLASWRVSIAHVPQNVFLINATIAENIAFGIPKNEINMAKLKKVCEQALLSNFIENTEGGYFSITGERGIKLSGGQCQRIGIARALYKESNILVLDEATSALDNQTEALIIKSLENIDREITLIFIAHRYSSLKNCDRIIEIKNGKVESEGSFESFTSN